MTEAAVVKTEFPVGPMSVCRERREWRWVLAHSVILSALLFLLYRGVLPSIGTRVWGGEMDPPLILMQFKWVADFILGRTPAYIKSVFSFPIYYPYSNSFALSDTLFGNQPLWLPVYALSNNPILATNVWIAVCHILNYAAFSYYIFRSSLLGRISLQKRTPVAMLCGALFAFSSARIDGHVHLQLMPHFWTPLALLMLDRTFARPRWHTYVLLAGTVAMQWYAGVHLAIMLTVLLVPLGIVYCGASRGPRRARLAVGLSASAVLAFGLVIPDLIPRISAVRLGLTFEERWVIDAAPGFTGLARTVHWEGLARGLGLVRGALCHEVLFPGILMSLLLIVSAGSLAARPRRPPLSWVCAFLLLLFYFMATGHELLVRGLPLFRLFREPTRFALGAVAPGLLLGAESLGAILTTRRLRIAVVAALALLMAEIGARRIRAGRYRREPETGFEHVLRLSAHRPVMLLPQSVDTPNNPSRVIMSQQQMELLSHSWVPGLAGRSGPRPPFVESVTAQSLELLTSRPVAAAFAARARRLGYAAVIVMPHATHDAYCRALSPILGPGRPAAGGYRYFGLYSDPTQAPRPDELDMGQEFVQMISDRAFSVRVRRKTEDAVVLELQPNTELCGVVQQRVQVGVPFALVSERGTEARRDVPIILDRVTDCPTFKCLLPIPAAPSEWRLSTISDGMRIPVPSG